jgi:hypothetical protein
MLNIECVDSKLKAILPVKEKMNIFIPGISEMIPNRNGACVLYCGPPGSGKTSLLLSMFKSKAYYRSKFSNIYYYCPSSSFDSVEKHVFEKHDKVYHNLDNLSELYDLLSDLKESNEDEEIEYNAVIIDDMADSLKDKNIVASLTRLLTKSRHLHTMFFFTLQSYYLFSKLHRKLVTNIIIFKPSNSEEYMNIAKELLNLNVDNSLQLYDYVFSESFSHLDIDTRTNQLSKNFNKLIITKPK